MQDPFLGAGRAASGEMSMLQVDLSKFLPWGRGQQAKVFPQIHQGNRSFPEGTGMGGQGGAARVLPSAVSPGQQRRSLYLNGNSRSGNNIPNQPGAV